MYVCMYVCKLFVKNIGDELATEPECVRAMTTSPVWFSLVKLVKLSFYYLLVYLIGEYR